MLQLSIETANPETLNKLQTELVCPSLAAKLHTLDTFGLCAAFNKEEAAVAPAVAAVLPQVAVLVDELVLRLRAGGRLVYVGAGNSGRVASMDCAELPVTFSADPTQFLVCVAGGPEAVATAVEAAEDNLEDGVMRMNSLELKSEDTVIGISASGRTPFVLGALRVAKQRGALTAAITNCLPSLVQAIVQHPIAVLVGPEFVTGSTRLKAGSVAKQLLNMISTCAMIKLGKTYKGLMVDLRANNLKLKVRGREIVRQVCDSGEGLTRQFATTAAVDMAVPLNDTSSIDALIEQCGGSVKLACAVALSGLDPIAAKERLAAADGQLEEFVHRLGNAHARVDCLHQRCPQRQFTMCIDGGGTKCAVSIAAVDTNTNDASIAAQAVTGACNLNSVAFEEAVEQIALAATEAMSKLPVSCAVASKGTPSCRPKLAKCWVGIAGLHHSGHAAALSSCLEDLLGVSVAGGSLQLTCDTTLLSSSMVCLEEDVDECICLVAGTGAVAARFRAERQETASFFPSDITPFLSSPKSSEIVQVGRAGGWGHLVGDDGSAFYIGRQALRQVLVEENYADPSVASTQLHAAILKHFSDHSDKHHQSGGNLLSTILGAGGQQARERIGSIAQLVTRLAFAPANPDAEALAILEDAASCLANLVHRVAVPRHLVSTDQKRGKCALVVSGALMNLPPFKNLVLDKCRQLGLCFETVVVVVDVSASTAIALSRTLSRKDESSDLADKDF